MVTFPAAPMPDGIRRFRRVAGVVAAVAAIWAAVAVQGTGVGGLLAGIAVVCAVPVAWQLAMTPHAYSIEGEQVQVHRRWLPDSTFVMRGSPERLAVAAARSPDAASGEEGYGDRFARISRTRVLSAMTDSRKGVRIAIGRSGALVISPDDPDAFVRAAEGGGFR
jgi:hypothetical protein